jgi:hypothetical protein
LFTVANDGLVFSDNGSCGWTAAGGTVVGQLMTDVFPDPSDADHVLAVGYDGGVFGIFPSVDGGATFGAPLYTAAAGDGIGGVEIARSDPRVIYAAMTTAATTTPKLVRSRDGGATWAITDLGAVLGAGAARIVAVDAQDANVVLLRLMGADGETLALSRDGGATVTPSLSIPGQLTAYVALPSGTRLVGALVDSSTTAALFRSHDGGATFEPVASPPHIRALSQRGGLVYAAADNFGDGYALGASTDEGTTWSPVMRYEQIQAILGCLRADPQCQSTCQLLAGQGTSSPAMIWDAGVCSANPAVPEPPLPEPPMKGDGGCGCDVAGGAHPVLVLVLVLVLASDRARARARARARHQATDVRGG